MHKTKDVLIVQLKLTNKDTKPQIDQDLKEDITHDHTSRRISVINK
jgi:hypothetical protein